MSKQQDIFVMTPSIEEVLEKAKIFVKAGLTIHLTGPAGVGKTSLALKIAKDLDSLYYFIQGDETFTRNDLVGGLYGYYQKVVEDNFIPSVSKVERLLTPIRVDNPVALACQEGRTLIYDEFTRARPETNNVLLGILSEKVLLITDRSGKLTLVDVHPNFRLILTSNPKEYVGIYKTQDALQDRLVTIQLNQLDEETEALITAKHNNLSRLQARKIIRFVRKVHESENLPHSTTRMSIMIGKIYQSEFQGRSDKRLFIKCCQDIMGLDAASFNKVLDLWEKATHESEQPNSEQSVD
ncbi:MAG TPA: gas vesicle protein GvpN [Firmicutes bacterium]|jgi:nitric oxide reductase NorQ protein|nr:gas vesicle protein GvpN [Bacillota bacterium]